MNQFEIYDASAGSGKTYQLTQQYLLRCMKGDFSGILAITFTNKAAREMKQRIVSALYDLSHDPSHQMMGFLHESTGMPTAAIQERCRLVLRDILHNYSSFSVSTIDRFVNRLIRSFARDFDLSVSYAVEIESREILREAVDALLAGLGEHSPATQVVSRFVESKLREGRSPRPERHLNAVAGVIFQEDSLPHLSRLAEIETDQMLAIRQKLRQQREGLRQQIREKATSVRKYVDGLGWQPEDFSRGTPYNFLVSWAGEDEAIKFPTNTCHQQMTGEKDLGRKDSQHLFEPHLAELLPRFESLYQTIEKHYPRWDLAGRILENFDALALLRDIQHELQDIKSRTNRLPIGEFNQLVSEKLQNQPAAYIYERLGERYRHYFIDEFQDTSRLQWQNLQPLINNAMSSGGSVMLVGDPKQSIYRFRGSEVEQFIDISEDRDSGNKVQTPEGMMRLYDRKRVPMGVNYRSRPEVVAFNNSFFPEAAGMPHPKNAGEFFLNREDYRQLFTDHSLQKAHRQLGGYVSLERLFWPNGDKEHYREAQAKRILDIVLDVRERHYLWEDIAVLVNKNADGRFITRYLIENGIPVVSPESLVLASDPDVCALASYAGFWARPDHRELRYDFLERIWEKTPGQWGEKHAFLKKYLGRESQDFRKDLETLVPGYRSDDFQPLHLPDQLYRLARLLGIDLQNNRFIHSFFDALLEFYQRYGDSRVEWLSWWEEQGSQKSLKLEGQQGAVQVMTIHKSKGLQFKVCVFAFVDWEVADTSREEFWLDLEHQSWTGLPSARLKAKSDSNLTDESYREQLIRTREQVQLDSFNRLYVGFTRAEDELYVLAARKERTDNGSVARIIGEYMKSRDAEDRWERGKRGRAESVRHGEDNPLETYETAHWDQKLYAALRAPEYWQPDTVGRERQRGRKWHELLSKLDNVQKPEDLLAAEQARGHISAEEREAFAPVLEALLKHPELKAYFGETGLNERDILLPGSPSLRPDRVVMAGDATHILDYKTGKAREEHREQVNEYRRALCKMNYPDGDNVLIYWEGDEPRVVRWRL